MSCLGADLFQDDFSRFPADWLSSPVGSLNGAIQEYHYLPNRGVPLGAWANAISHLDPWIVSAEVGHSSLEQQLDATARQCGSFGSFGTAARNTPKHPKLGYIASM